MQSLHRTALVYTAAFIAASCGGNGEAPSDELLRDLSAAQSSSIELATRVQDYQPTRFVTAIEQLPSAAPSRAKALRRVFNPPAISDVPSVKETTPDPQPAEEIVQTNVPAPEPQIVSSVPSVVPRPTATAATPAPSGEAEGRGEGPSRGEVLGTLIGETIGVIIRGGPVGVGHCPPRRGRGRGQVILPLEIPIVRPGVHR